MAVYYSGVRCELREVVLKNKPQAMLEISPKGTVPVLLDSGKVIDESIDVMSWALRQSDPDHWLRQPIDHQMIQRSDGEFKFDLDRYKYFDRYPEQSQEWYFNKGLGFLQELESMLVHDNDGHYFLENAQLSLLDVAIFPFVRQFAFVDKVNFDAQNLPKLQAWLKHFLCSSLFLSVMDKYPPWAPDAEQRILFGT